MDLGTFLRHPTRLKAPHPNWPIARYECSETERQQLRSRLTQVLADLPLAELSDDDAAVLCIFCASWWRDAPASALWDWSSPLSALSVTGFSPTTVSTVIARGLKRLQRPSPFAGLPRQTLLSLACDAGLPRGVVDQAEDVTRWVCRILRQLRQHEVGHTPFDLEALAHRCRGGSCAPLSHDISDRMVGGLAGALWQLRQQLGPLPSSGLEAWLDARQPGWRAEGSLWAVDDGSFLQNLAAAVNAVVGGPLPVIRVVSRLRLGETPTLHRELVFPIQTDDATLSGLFQGQALPLQGRLALLSKDGVQPVGSIRHQGMENQWVASQNRGMSASGSGRISLSFQHGLRAWTVPLPGGGACSSQPWTFHREDSGWTLVAEGTCTLTAETALVALPSGAMIDRPSFQGVLYDRDIHEVTDMVSVLVGDQRYTIQAGHEADDGWQAELVGPRCSLPGMEDIWLGWPSLSRRDGQPEISLEELEFRIPDGSWQRADQTPFGSVEVRAVEAGVTRFFQRIQVVPPDFSIQLHPDPDGDGGAISVLGDPVQGVDVVANPTEYETRSVGTDRVIVSPVNSVLPDQLVLLVQFGAAPAPLSIIVPSPRSTVQFVGAAGEIVPPGTTLHLSDLETLSLLVCACDATVGHALCLRLINAERHEEQFVPIPVPIGSYARYSLWSLVSSASRLMGLSSSLEAGVRLSVVRIGEGPLRGSVDICRYVRCLEPQKSVNRILLDSVGPNEESPVVEAYSLASLDEAAPRPLPVNQDQTWTFSPEEFSAGQWLIGVRRDPMCRPVLWSIVGGGQRSSTLGEILKNTRAQRERLPRLVSRLSALSPDQSDPDWRLLQAYLSRVSSLPLSSLDVFRALARTPRVVVASVMSMPTAQALEFWTQMETLPFLWEATSIAMWRDALSQWSQGRSAASVLPLVDRFSDRLLTAKIAANQWRVQHDLGGSAPPSPPAAALCFLRNQHIGELIERHQADHWPGGGDVMVMLGKTPLLRRLQVSDERAVPERQPVLNAPVLVAAAAAGLVELNPRLMPVLVACRAFDPDWFDRAWQLSLLAAGDAC